MAAWKFIIVILLLFSFTPRLKSESLNLKPKKNFTCPARGLCGCKPVDDVIIFECDQGPRGLQYTVTVNGTKDELVMDCRCASAQDCSTMYRPGMFADFNVKSIESVHFMSCPLPNISYSQLLGDLNPLELSISTYVGDIKLLQQVLFANLSGISQLTIKGGRMDSLQENVFEDLVNLQYLDLSVNMMLRLPDGIFNRTQNLTHLTLYANNLSELPKIHNELPSLEVLNLNSNRFTNLSENLFEFAPNLRNLSLTHNRLTQLSPNAFQNLRNLTSLDLSFNDLMELPKDLFQSNANLEELRIRLNFNLSDLPPDLLSAAKSLKTLDLGRNNISTLPETLLNNVPNLNYLDLCRNKLETIPETFFANSTQLISVDLSVNRISVLPNNVFKPLQNLRAINLHNNRLKSIGQDLFSHLPALKALDLSNNEIEVIQHESFSGSDNITWMDFTSNSIRFDTEPFALPPSLEHLNLTRNKITYLPTKWTRAKNLHNLNLTENNIQSVNSDELNYKTSVVLDLTHNQIMTVNLQDMNKTQVDAKTIDEKVPSVPTILINFNPMNCDCNLLQFVRFLKTKNNFDPNAPFQFVADNLTCALPRNSITTFQPLTAVQEDTLYCNLDQQCSLLCLCRKTPISRITEVHCEGKKLTDVIHRVPPNTSKAYFDNNSITSIAALQHLKWARLTEAHFSLNQISDMKTKIELPKSLKVLTLDGNKLTNFPQWLMDAVDRSESMTVALRNNSWACDCSSLAFYHWLQSAPPGKINDVGDVRCGPGPFYQKKMIAHDFVEFCPPQEDSSSSSAIVVTVLTLLVLFSALAFGGYCAMRHKFEIKMWLFRHRLCLWLRTEDDIESGHPL